jgi:hypothetical protein
MKSKLALCVFCCAVIVLPKTATAQERSNAAPLTGTWQCVAHGASQGDIPFTLYLEQSGEKVTGSVSSSLGDADITSATFKDSALEIHIKTDQGEYLLTAKLKSGELAGNWSHEDGKGTWQGKMRETTEQ